MPVTSVNGVALAYQEDGEGPPVVLVHGSWGGLHGWDLVAPKLAERYRVIRHDRRGHSESEAAGGTLEDDADDVVALAEHLSAVPFHLVCSSLGGVIGLKLAARRPDVLRSLVCHEPPALAAVPAEQSARIRRELAEPQRRILELIDAGHHDRAARVFVEDMAFGVGTWEKLPRFMKEQFIRNAPTYADESRDPTAEELDLDALRRFDHPVLLTTSDDSPSWYGAVIESLATLLPSVERHVYAGAGHGPQGTAAPEYVRVVGGFLAG